MATTLKQFTPSIQPEEIYEAINFAYVLGELNVRVQAACQ